MRVLTVGLRQFRRPDTNHPSWSKHWDWDTMLKLPGLHPERTQMAWDRLQSVGLPVTTAVDLLPPGRDFTEIEVAAAAAYLRGVVDGINATADDLDADSDYHGYDLVVLLGGLVADAFCKIDPRLRGMGLLSPRRLGTYDVVIMPSPHTQETGETKGWWTSPDKLAQLRDYVTDWKAAAVNN